MSVEVWSSVNHFLPKRKTPRNRVYDDNWTPSSISDASPVFIPNYLNDAESLWWIALFSQSSTIPIEEYEHTLEEMDVTYVSPISTQQRAHRSIFSAQQERLSFFKTEGYFDTFAKKLPVGFQKRTLPYIKSVLEELVDGYTELEKDFDNTDLSELYRNIAFIMRKAAIEAGVEVIALPLEVVTGSKRTGESLEQVDEENVRVSKRLKLAQ